jgi:hypothetical protein
MLTCSSQQRNTTSVHALVFAHWFVWKVDNERIATPKSTLVSLLHTDYAYETFKLEQSPWMDTLNATLISATWRW